MSAASSRPVASGAHLLATPRQSPTQAHDSLSSPTDPLEPQLFPPSPSSTPQPGPSRLRLSSVAAQHSRPQLAALVGLCLLARPLGDLGPRPLAHLSPIFPLTLSLSLFFSLAAPLVDRPRHGHHSAVDRSHTTTILQHHLQRGRRPTHPPRRLPLTGRRHRSSTFLVPSSTQRPSTDPTSVHTTALLG